jgi:AsmA protein
MSRRVVLALLALAALLAVAVAPWTMSSARLHAQVRQQLAEGYGLEISGAGRTTIALLPLPRVKFSGISLAAQDGTELVRGAQLRGELRLLPLLAGRLEIADLSIADARIMVAIGPDGKTSWDVPLAKLQARAARIETGPTHIRRLLLARSDIDIDDRRTGSRVHIGAVNFVLRWPTPDRGLDLAGSGRWGGEKIDVNLSGVQPAALANGLTSPYALQLGSRLGDATLSGEATFAGGFHLNGTVGASIPALDAFCRWTSLARPRPGTGRPLVATGELAVSPGEIGLPRLRLTYDGRPLDGAVALRIDGLRPSLRATLAGDALDLSPLLPAPGSQTGALPFDPADLDALRSADIDLRLSASAIQLAGIRFEDVASSLLTGPERIELSLSRANLNGGTLKGRAALASGPGGYDLKVQASVAQLDLGAFLASIGQARSVTGTAQGQAALESTGSTSEDFLRSLAGRASITVRPGELSGVSLGEALRQTDERTIGASSWRGGRTPFQQAQLSLNFAGGTAEIQDGSIDGAVLRTTLQGQILLAEGQVALKTRTIAHLDRARESPAFVLAIKGPWQHPEMVPSLETLTQRSGAASSVETR